ncbi:hypothetical protein CCP3SC1AL1_1280006 [Gammaproteobacteria bacterium]
MMMMKKHKIKEAEILLNNKMTIKRYYKTHNSNFKTYNRIINKSIQISRNLRDLCPLKKRNNFPMENLNNKF